ncbi:MFS transporter [Allorhizocola rhizosphaerae]|uniref:MFS transporter n=1 Tax=Allorhizocola rhizosphaerae TaxID=1872709 RepID=UPI000E3E27D4|nr:MFS transporter [Allorhizocola rhizosphaerae]
MSFATPARSRWSDVYLSASVTLVGATGAFLVMVTLVLGLQERGASGLQVATLIIAESLPMVVLGRFMGRLVDRFDSRLLLVCAGVGQVVSCQLLVNADRFEWVVAGGVALATFSAVAGPTRSALLPAMVTRDDLPKASAIGQTASSIGLMAGPALAGFLVGAGDVRGTLQIASFGFVATIVAGLLLKTRRGVASSKVDNAPPVDWKLSDDRMFRAVVWGMALIVGAVSTVNVVAVFFIRGTLGSSATMYGLVDAVWTAGMLAGAWLCARVLRPATTDLAVVRWMFVSLGIISVVVGAVGAVTAVLWIVPLYLVGGALNGGQNVIIGTLLGRRAPAAARGRAATALQSRVQGGALLGYVAGGLVLEVVEPRWVFVGAGVLGLLAVLLVAPGIVSTHETSQSRAHPVPELPSPVLGTDAVGRTH